MCNRVRMKTSDEKCLRKLFTLSLKRIFGQPQLYFRPCRCRWIQSVSCQRLSIMLGSEWSIWTRSNSRSLLSLSSPYTAYAYRIVSALICCIFAANSTQHTAFSASAAALICMCTCLCQRIVWLANSMAYDKLSKPGRRRTTRHHRTT